MYIFCSVLHTDVLRSDFRMWLAYNIGGKLGILEFVQAYMFDNLPPCLIFTVLTRPSPCYADRSTLSDKCKKKGAFQHQTSLKMSVSCQLSQSANCDRMHGCCNEICLYLRTVPRKRICSRTGRFGTGPGQSVTKELVNRALCDH
jgi:hypothetical protein